MSSVDTILRIGTILVSLAVVSVPILYPRYSLFIRRARSGIEKLQQVREEHEDVSVCYIERDETGFSELIESAEVAFGYNGSPECLCLAIGRPKDLGKYTGFGMEYGIGDNGVLYTVQSKGNNELLRWEAWSPTSTLKLEKISRGAEIRARERSHTITVVLAVLWATLSIVTVI
jgi:hypothetical protein